VTIPFGTGLVGCGNRTEAKRAARSQGRTSISRPNNSGLLDRSCNRSSGSVRRRLPKNPIGALRSWHRRTPYRTLWSWVFTSPQSRGKNPDRGQQLLRHHIRPVAHKRGITNRIGWNTFRRTYSTLLRVLGAELKVMLELMRHSTIRVTLDTYTQAGEACCTNRIGLAFHQ